MSTSKVWLITGCSSGFGRSMTEHALKHGDKVVATLRDVSSPVLDDLKAAYPAALRVVPLDVTQPAQIAAAFAHARDAFGGVDVVFNNAGRGAFGEVEGADEAAARAVFDTNFWGASNVSREAVRFFREHNGARGGRLLVNSSYLGLTTIPCFGVYAASKFALEGITQTLASELDPAWNIKITIIEAGFFRSSMSEKSVYAEAHPAYTNPDAPVGRVRAHMAAAFAPGATTKLGDVAKGVARLHALAGEPDPPLRLVLEKKAIADVRAQLTAVAECVDRYESWSEDLMEE